MDTISSIDPEHVRIAQELEADGVRFAVGSFMDITGRAKSKVVPIDHLPNLLAGSERYTPRGMGDLGVMTPNEDECVAMPDPAKSEKMCACVIPRNGHTLTLKDLADFLHDKEIARFKLPKAFVYVPAIQRSPSGKADYRWARQRALEAAPTS